MNSLTNISAQYWRSVSKTVKTAFFTACIVGFVTHITVITNRLYNHDSLFAGMPSNGLSGLQQGKWFSVVSAYILRGNSFSASAVVIIGILLLALTAALTILILDIKSKLWAAGIASFIVLFPSVMSTNSYLSSGTFFFALFLAALAVYFTVRYKHGYWLGILMLTLACGTYAVFIGYAAGLFVILTINDLFDGDKPVKDILLTGLKYLAVLLVSALLYYVVLQVLLQIFQTPLSDYRNIDNVGNFTLSSLMKAIYESYRKVYYFFYYGIHLYRTSFSIEPMFRVLNWLTLGLSAVFTVALTVQNGIRKNLPRVLLTLVLLVLFPLAIHAIGVLGQNAYTHWIMIYPFVLVYVYMLSCADRLELRFLQPSESVNAQKIVKTCVLWGTIATMIVSALLIRQWFLTTNQGYEFLRRADQYAYAQGALLTDDIRETSGYTSDTPVVMLGDGAPPAFQYTTGDFELVASADGTKYTGINLPIVDTTRLKLLLRNWVGVTMNYADESTVAYYSELPEVISMPVYPAQGSIVMKDGYLLVKMSEVSTGSTEAP